MTDHSDAALQEARRLAADFEVLEGRRPRLYLAGLTRDDEAHTKMAAASIFSDLGWDVDMGPENDSAEGAVQDASDNDVHMIGLFVQPGNGREVWDALTEARARLGREDILLFVFGDLSEEERTWFVEHGACLAFPGEEIAAGCLSLLRLLADMAAEEAREG